MGSDIVPTKHRKKQTERGSVLRRAGKHPVLFMSMSMQLRKPLQSLPAHQGFVPELQSGPGRRFDTLH